MNSQNSRGIWRAGSLFLTIAIVILAGLFINRKEEKNLLEFSSDHFSISLPTGDITVPFSEITSLTLKESPDYGKPDGGSLENNVRLGQWKSDMFGTYLTYSLTSIVPCIEIQATGQTYVISIEDERSTKELCEALLKVSHGDVVSD